MKSILVVGHDSRTFRDVLATAWLVAERYESYVEGMAIRAWVPAASFAGIEGIGAGTIDSLVAEEAEHARRLKSIFLDFARGHEVCADPGTNERGTVIANWPVDEPELTDTLGGRGRVFDLIVIGRSGDTHAAPHSQITEAALFDTGRPVLIAPQSMPKSVGNTVLIAWNGAAETARAVAFALPFLHAAGDVRILEVEEGSVLGPKAQDLQTYLTRQGISSQVNAVAKGGKDIGPIILEEAASIGADLVIKGAYTHSRLRQLIFGGATQHILASSSVPVLMAH